MGFTEEKKAAVVRVKQKIAYEDEMLEHKRIKYEKLLAEQYEDYLRKLDYARTQHETNTSRLNRKLAELEDLLGSDIV